MSHHKHRRSSKRRNSKNMVMKTLDQSVVIAKNTSKKYMPKVKTGLENVGSKVISTSQQSIPFLQRMTRKFFNMFSFSSKTKKNRKH
jgi:hypothetical protein